jgi:hypothetical protein
MLNVKNTNRLLPVLAISSTLIAVITDRSYAGPLTSSKKAFDDQITLIEGGGGGGLSTIGGPIFALVVIFLIIFTIITIGMAAFEGGGNLPLRERVTNVMQPALFITVGLGILGGLVTWIATI